jgi:hypothetical protein
MSNRLRDREHRSDNRYDVDPGRAEDQAEDALQDVGLDRCDLRLEAQPGALCPEIAYFGWHTR